MFGLAEARLCEESMKKRLLFAGILLVVMLTLLVGVHPTANAAEGVSLEAKFWVDRAYIWEGEYIGLRFKFVNTGTVTISNLTVRDASVADGAWLNSAITLAPGETRIVTYNLPLNHDVTLSPTVQYSAGGSTRTYNFQSQELYIIDDSVTMTLESSTTTPAAGEEVTFTLHIRNDGNVPYRNLKLYNHNNELIPTRGTQLWSGDSVSVVTTATFKESDEVQFDMTATDAYGTVYSHASNTIKISVPINFDVSALSVTAEAQYNKLSSPGPASFDVLISNKSEYGLYDISIIDTGTNEVVSNISNMEKGDRLVRVSTQVDETREVVFEVQVHDADGNTFTVDTKNAPTTVTILSQLAEEQAAAAAASAAAMPTPTPSAPPEEGLAALSGWTLASIGFGTAILVVVIVLIALTIASKKRPRGGDFSPMGMGDEPAPKKTKKEKEQLRGSSMPPINPVPKKRPSGPKKKAKKKKRKGPIRVSYRDGGGF